MDFRWPVLAGGVLAAGGAAAGAWSYMPDPLYAAAIGLAVAACGGAAFEATWRRRETAALRQELAKLKRLQSSVESEVSVAKDSMLAVHQALSSGGGAVKQRMQVMADEMVVLQKLVSRLQSTAQGSADPVIPIERDTKGLLSNEDVLALVRTAVSDGVIDLYLQPVVTLPQRRRRYYECFSRISDQRGGVLAADAYVAAAEAAGLIAPIDNLLLFRAVQLVRRARSQSAQVGFFCNVSRHTLKDSGFLTDFVEFLEENADLAPSLILEIAQSDWDPDDADLARYMHSLAGLGVRFSLDRVENFAIDGARLRRRGFRFVKAAAGALLCEGGPNAHSLKRSLGLENIQLIVEKVETERDLVELLEHDIELGQGFLFGAPKAAAQPVAA